MRVSILGDGLLGSEIRNQTGWSVYSRKMGNFRLDDRDLIYEICDNCDVVVNCIANTNTYDDDEQLHRKVNYEFVAALVNICNANRTKLVHISTEFVYANNIGLPSEDTIPLPANNWYARTKLMADNYIQHYSLDYLICRELHKPNPFPYNKVWRVQTSGDTVDVIASLIIRLITKQASGLYNVGTGDKYLRDLAPLAEEIDPPPQVPTDTRMDLTKLKKLINE